MQQLNTQHTFVRVYYVMCRVAGLCFEKRHEFAVLIFFGMSNLEQKPFSLITSRSVVKLISLVLNYMIYSLMSEM